MSLCRDRPRFANAKSLPFPRAGTLADSPYGHFVDLLDTLIVSVIRLINGYDSNMSLRFCSTQPVIVRQSDLKNSLPEVVYCTAN